MSRTIVLLATTALALSGVGHAHAADWGAPTYDPMFKPAYPMNYAQPDPLEFEMGLRYWYAFGSQSFALSGAAATGGGSYSSEDVSHIVEGHLRIDDRSTNTYLKGSLGYAGFIDGSYSTPFEQGSIHGGHVSHGVVDFGYSALDAGATRLGGFVGYQYLNDSPNMGRGAFSVPDSLEWTPGSPNYTIGRDSKHNSLDIHALRLGVSGRAELGNSFDISAEVAAVPYAWATGNFGAHSFDPNVFPAYAAPFAYDKSSVTTIDGHLYGGAAELMVGFKPTENLAIRFGAKGYYLTGPTTAYYSSTTIQDPQDIDGNPGFEVPPAVATQAHYRQFSNVEMWRWGPMIELTGRF